VSRTKRRTAADPTLVLGYVRVSTTEQGGNGHGLDAQRDAISAVCAARGWRLLDVHEDVAGGGTTNGRHGLADALARLERGEAGGLVVAKLDRLSRSVIDAAQTIDLFRRRGWNLVILDLGLDLSSPMGEMAANMAAVFAQFERRVIGERTKAALAAKRARGEKLGGLPQIAAIVEHKVLSLRERGLSMAAIADELNASGVPTVKDGARWHASTVQRVLVRHEGVER
jgi:DNA invertase Pin-like site-specific DNA recombinase